MNTALEYYTNTERMTARGKPVDADSGYSFNMKHSRYFQSTFSFTFFHGGNTLSLESWLELRSRDQQLVCACTPAAVSDLNPITAVPPKVTPSLWIEMYVLPEAGALTIKNWRCVFSSQQDLFAMESLSCTFFFLTDLRQLMKHMQTNTWLHPPKCWEDFCFKVICFKQGSAYLSSPNYQLNLINQTHS